MLLNFKAIHLELKSIRYIDMGYKFVLVNINFLITDTQTSWDRPLNNRYELT